MQPAEGRQPHHPHLFATDIPPYYGEPENSDQTIRFLTTQHPNSLNLDMKYLSTFLALGLVSLIIAAPEQSDPQHRANCCRRLGGCPMCNSEGGMHPKVMPGSWMCCCDLDAEMDTETHADVSVDAGAEPEGEITEGRHSQTQNLERDTAIPLGTERE